MNPTVKKIWTGLRQRARRGVAAVEFALTMPVWVTFLLGTVDGSYCLLVNEKADRIAYSVTDIVTQYQTISLANLSDITLAAGQLMKPFPFTGNSDYVIVTSVFQAAGKTPTICWQYKNGIVGSGVTTGSKIGTPNNSGSNCANGGAAILPNGLTLNDNDNVIISEVYYQFTPLFLSSGLFNSGTVYRVAMYKPRLSPLVTPPT